MATGISPAHITALVLAGGRGARMGHVDKGLQAFRGEAMVAHVIRRVSPQAGSVMINANQNLDTYAGFGLPVWPDTLAGFEGPLAGVQTGLAHCGTDYLLTVPCDSPFLPADLAERLAAALLEHEADLAVAYTGAGATKQPHPVFCLMKATLLPQLDAYLQAGGRKIDTWHRTQKLAEVAFADEDAFRNINTLDDLHRYESSRPS